MKLWPANVADILRCYQRDSFIIEKIDNYVTDLFQFFPNKFLAQEKIEKISALIYYILTSFSELQTLGEEYSGTIRFIINTRQFPTKLTTILWLSLHLGGETLLDKFLSILSEKVSKTNTCEAKDFILKLINFIKSNKKTFIRLHIALFYTNGNYYHISHRILGIKYYLLRQWFQNSSYTQSFKLLGFVLSAYLMFHLYRQFKTFEQIEEPSYSKPDEKQTKICLICSENMKNVTSTFCGHLFCWECIQSSLQFQNSCPVCREPIGYSRIIPLQNY